MLNFSLFSLVLMIASILIYAEELMFMLLVLWGLMMLAFSSMDTFFGVSSLLNFDLMSLLLAILSVWISLLMLLVVANTVSKNSAVFLYFLTMMLCMLLHSFMFLNLFGFYLFFEGVLIPIVMMIYLWGGQPERVIAGIYILMYTLFGSLPLLVILLKFNANLSMSFLFMEIFNGDVLKFWHTMMLIFAFLVKMPLYSVHLWLPKAHVEAPVVGSMVLAGVLLKLGGYGLYRVYTIYWYSSLYSVNYIFMSLSLVGAVIVGFICLRQVDIKSLIAYSSVCHMGLVIGGFFSGVFWGGWGLLIMMVGHGLCSSAMFCLANMMYERFYTRSLMILKGLMLSFPVLGFWWFIFSVINMGAPPSMNLLGEIMLMGSILSWCFFTFVLLGLASFMGACYSLYLFSMSQHGNSWFLYSVFLITHRDYLLLYAHFFPLLMYVFKMEVFTIWVS